MTLSVVIANFNHAPYLEVCLQSILAQSKPPDQIIIVDDASTDNSVELIKRFERENRSIELIENARNLGAVATFNRALEAADSEYVLMYGADDMLLPGFIEKSMSLLSKFPKSGLCCSHPAFLDDVTGLVDKHDDWYHYSRRPVYIRPYEIVRVAGPEGLWIASHTVIYRKQALIEAGGYIPDLHWACDWFLTHAIALRHGACYIPEALSALRVLPNSYSSVGRRNARAQSEVTRTLIRLLNSSEFADLAGKFCRSKLFDNYPDFKDALLENIPSKNSWAHFRINSRIGRMFSRGLLTGSKFLNRSQNLLSHLYSALSGGSSAAR